jgi:S1-C subfamily serine protease
VQKVEPRSPADEAGVTPGDVITQINQTSITALDDFKKLAAIARGPALIKTQRGYFIVQAQ